MAIELPPNAQLMEEDFIDMDIGSATFLCYNVSSSPPRPKEFEFQMSINIPQKEALPSPADELFYKGKLLPLHLPPRLQMVQKLLETSGTGLLKKDVDSFEKYMATSSITLTETSTPFESCNISPITSCYVSGELNPEDYFHECSTGHVQPHKKSWVKKLKLIRQASFSLKLKASGAYIKSLFSRSKCSVEPSCTGPKAKESSNGFHKAAKRNPSDSRNLDSTNNVIKSTDGEKPNEEDSGPRRSFSLAIKRCLKNKSSTSSSSCSSSSSSFSSASSDGSSRPHIMRSSSVHSEFENSIQGAIAHCKMSQQLLLERKSMSDVRFDSVSASRIAVERPMLYRG